MRMFFQNTKPFGQMLAVFMFMLVGFVLSLMVTIVFIFVAPNVDLMQEPNAIRCTQIVSQLLLFVLPACLWVFCFGKNAKDDLQLQFGGKYWLLALLGLLCYVLFVPLINAVTNWNQAWELPQALADVFRQMTAQSEEVLHKILIPTENFGVLMFNLLVIAVTPAICEELFFRGALQTIMVRWLHNPHVAIWITSFVFSVFHGDLYGLMPRWLLGLLLGYLYYYSGSLLVNVLMHFVNNAIAVVCYYLYYEHNVAAANPDVQTSIAGWIVVLCTVAAVFLFYYFFVLKYKKSEFIGKEIE